VHAGSVAATCWRAQSEAMGVEIRTTPFADLGRATGFEP
jgi:hypothetical protein